MEPLLTCSRPLLVDPTSSNATVPDPEITPLNMLNRAVSIWLGAVNAGFSPSVMSFQFGLTFAKFAQLAGPVIGPLIGYEQDYAATRGLETDAPDAYKRYKTDTPEAPLPFLPKIAGLDNGKVGVLDDYEDLKKKAPAPPKPGAPK